MNQEQPKKDLHIITTPAKITAGNGAWKIQEQFRYIAKACPARPILLDCGNLKEVDFDGAMELVAGKIFLEQRGFTLKLFGLKKSVCTSAKGLEALMATFTLHATKECAMQSLAV